MPNRKTNKLPLVLIGIGIILIGYWAVHRVIYWHTLELSRSQVHIEEPQQVPANFSEPVHITIPSLVDVDIESMTLIGTTWAVSPDKASFLSQSARPGSPGNIIIYGHNKRKILGNLRSLTGGEVITLTTSDGAMHQYQVTRLKQTDPTDVDWLQPTSKEVLTMYTCSGVFDSKRFIIQALPI